MIKLAAAFLLLSGTASLTYQVVWVRLLGLSMGSTSASISTVLAAFFLGLALGSYLAERITRNRIHNLKVYLILESVIGIAGMLLLPVLLNLDYLVTSMPQLAAGLGFKFFISIVLLSIPTICMGATFPVMASILIRKQNEVGLRMGQLYSLNTAGAVCGAALAGFYFIPNWGLDGAVYIAVSINALIVIVGLRLNRNLALPPIELESKQTGIVGEISEHAPYRRPALLILFATGLVSIAVEVAWTKYLAVFTGTTIYGFAAILTVFLVGIAGGSWAIKSYLEKIEQPQLWMSFGLLLLALSLFMTRAALTSIPPIYQAINHFPVDPWLKHAVKYCYVFMLLILPTFIFGALFPLNLRLYCGGLSGVRARIGKAYAVNTLAGIVGSVAAGFFIIPTLGTDWLLSVAALIIAILAIIFLNRLRTGFARATLVVGLILTVSSNWFFPNINYQDLISSVQYDDQAFKGEVPEYLFLREGKAGVISMSSYDGRHVRLQNNGLNESFLDLEDDLNVLLSETLLGVIPYLLHDDAKNAFVVGFGGGVTTRALALTQIPSIKVVELEPAVVEAGRALVKGEMPVLEDPRVSLEINDARNTLLLSKQKYDVIVAQPSHPWLARASNVFTQDFFQIVHSRLNDNGIYGQWVNLFNMDATTLKSIMRAFYNVFPEGVSFANLETGDLLLFGSDKALKVDYEKVNQRIKEDKLKKALAFHGIKHAEDLFWYFALSRNEIIQAVADTEANTDTNILSEVRLSRLYGDAKGKEDPYKFLRSVYSLDVIEYLDGDIEEKLDSLAQYFFYWNKPKLALKIGKQLAKLNQGKATAIQFRAYNRSYQYRRLEQTYNAPDTQLNDGAKYYYVLALLAQSRTDEAFKIINSMQDAEWKQLAQARYLNAIQDWAKLAAIKSASDRVEMWRLLGVAQQHLQQAGKQLLKIKDNVDFELEQLQVLLTYYGVNNDIANVRVYSEKVQNRMSDLRSRIRKLLDSAIKKQQVERVRRLLYALAGYNPSENDMRYFKRKLAELEAMAESTIDSSGDNNDNNNADED